MAADNLDPLPSLYQTLGYDGLFGGYFWFHYLYYSK